MVPVLTVACACAAGVMARFKHAPIVSSKANDKKDLPVFLFPIVPPIF
jgi:hypothetical protein